jgi:hypothetical protein
MRARVRSTAIVGGVLGAAMVTVLILVPTAGAGRSTRTLPFEDARLKIEYNATDGDAGLQIFADTEAPWQEITVSNPAGQPVAHFEADDVIEDFGLTELFSESSEPPFTEFPFEEFKQLFPAGTYTFRGVTIDGARLQSTFVLTHDVPDGPHITSPADGATLRSDGLVVTWDPVTTPNGIDVVAYEVIVVDDNGAPSGGERTLDVTLPGTAIRFPVPAEFLVRGTYKAEVLAIDDDGNQTLNEVAFRVR